MLKWSDHFIQRLRGRKENLGAAAHCLKQFCRITEQKWLKESCPSHGHISLLLPSENHCIYCLLYNTWIALCPQSWLSTIFLLSHKSKLRTSYGVDHRSGVACDFVLAKAKTSRLQGISRHFTLHLPITFISILCSDSFRDAKYMIRELGCKTPGFSSRARLTRASYQAPRKALSQAYKLHYLAGQTWHCARALCCRRWRQKPMEGQLSPARREWMGMPKFRRSSQLKSKMDLAYSASFPGKDFNWKSYWTAS